jgi:predicted nuclease with TOPRIM domain
MSDSYAELQQSINDLGAQIDDMLEEKKELHVRIKDLETEVDTLRGHISDIEDAARRALR